MTHPHPRSALRWLWAAVLLGSWVCGQLPAEESTAWRRLPEPLASLLEAESPPAVILSPCRRWLLLVHTEGMPEIATLARPHRKLAGLRIDPVALSQPLGARVTKMVLRPVAGGADWGLPLEPGFWLAPEWSADGARIAIPRAGDDGIGLWLVDIDSRSVRRLPGLRLNAVLGKPVAWMHDQQTLLTRLASSGQEPRPPATPAGPIVRETAGNKAQVRTYQNLLQNADDVADFDFLATVQLGLVRLDGTVDRVGSPARIVSAEPSPDDSLLLVSTLEKPFSFLVPWDRFARRVVVMRRDGTVVQTVAELPPQETVPIGGVATGPRSIEWLPTEPATLVWMEALDGGDPKSRVRHRDVVRRLAPGAEPSEWFRTEYRCQSIAPAEKGRFAIVTEVDRDTRTQKLWSVDTIAPGGAPQLLLERSTQDAYGDPGTPVLRTDGRGNRAIRQDGDAIFLSGPGGSPEGERPFLDRWDLASGTKKRLFESAADRHESFVGFLGDDGRRALVSSESFTEPANFVAVDLADGKRVPLTHFEEPAAALVRDVKPVLLRYTRADGTPLSGQLYLPPGWTPGTKLPVLVWAYPMEFNQAAHAGQVRGSPRRFMPLRQSPHLWLVLAGYAVLDQAAMPIVGPVRTANDTFVEQLVSNAEAAVAALVEHGVGRRGAMAAAGHSYGAFMTANLLCHSDLFATGIARSGAFNRTLTPFGFQNEDRTYWQAPDVYRAMSPFAHADALNEPLLLIHGADDENEGTFPMQSQRLYAAVKGNGGHARLVLLPHEGHVYRARESVQHCLREMLDWLDRHLPKDGTRQ